MERPREVTDFEYRYPMRQIRTCGVLQAGRAGLRAILTESGRVIAEGRVPVWVRGDEWLLRHHGMLPPDGKLDSQAYGPL